MRILITNDDGYRSPGLLALERIAARFGETIVVAPDRDRSGISHAITLAHPLRVVRVDPDAERYEVVGGTPTDCVYLGLHRVLEGQLPDLVLSGINPGPNLGWDVLYSGTVAGAREAVLQGIPGVAISLLPGPEYPFDEVAPWVEEVLRQSIARPPAPYTCLNVNVPNPRVGPIRGIRPTRLGVRHYSKEVAVRADPRGREYVWIGGKDVYMPDVPGSDCNAVREGHVSVTPLTCDVTCRASLEDMTEWNIDKRG